MTASKEKLMESEEKYRLIAENANDIIGILNREFNFEFTNEHATFNILGYKASEVVGKNVLEFLHPMDTDKGMKALLKGLYDKEGMTEIRAKHKDGSYIWLEVKGRVFVDKNGKNKGILVARDITYRKEAELKLKKSEERFRKYFKGGPNFIVAWQKVKDDFILIDFIPVVN